MTQRHFVVLDRDGTIISERHYLSDPRQVELLPGAAEGLRLLSEMGLGLVVVTNQSGIGRGFFTQERLQDIHLRMQELLAAQKVHLDGIYYCPHTPKDNCFCRKPRTGLVERAKKDFSFNPTGSFVIGDKPCDIELGNKVGARTILVKTGYGADFVRDKTIFPDYVVDNLAEAAQMIARELNVVIKE